MLSGIALLLRRKYLRDVLYNAYLLRDEVRAVIPGSVGRCAVQQHLHHPPAAAAWSDFITQVITPQVGPEHHQHHHHAFRLPRNAAEWISVVLVPSPSPPSPRIRIPELYLLSSPSVACPVCSVNQDISIFFFFFFFEVSLARDRPAASSLE